MTNYGKKDEKLILTNDSVTEKIQQNIAQYDKSGEQHYETTCRDEKTGVGTGGPEEWAYHHREDCCQPCQARQTAFGWY